MGYITSTFIINQIRVYLVGAATIKGNLYFVGTLPTEGK